MSSDTPVARYRSKGGLVIERTAETVPYEGAVEPIIDALDEHLGVLLASGFEYPGRYSRWDVGFFNPPLCLSSCERRFEIQALNERGQRLLPFLRQTIASVDAVLSVESDESHLVGEIRPGQARLPEEQRSKQHSIFSVLRALIAALGSDEDSVLGLYGAFGYDLAFQFETIEFHQTRPADRRDLVLYLPDRILVVDHNRRAATQYTYDFETQSNTHGLPRSGRRSPFVGAESVARARDHAPGEYADVVRRVHEWFRRGDLFEVVPGQTFFEPCRYPPSAVFRRIRESNPAPYSTLMNLDRGEYLVGASPEMYLRSEGRRIETCPISGTIARGEDAIGDAQQILKLLSSEKETAELTMCTDVDRNDKSRVCEPGSVHVIGRRQIELYSRLIHTVDHVEGILRPEFDALDAFLSHAWAVTVTGAPKLWAMRFIEQHERSHRAWYGGAIGYLGFNGNINTGLTLRTMRIKDGVAELRAGGTLLIDADPDSEERETELKVAAFRDAVLHPIVHRSARPVRSRFRSGEGRHILVLDHEDSFVNTLSDYFRQVGARVTTVRVEPDLQRRRDILALHEPDLVVLSPGPGSPKDFDVAGTVALTCDLGRPLFGVCLGLQGIVEYFGGELGVLPYPVHGKETPIEVLGGRLFEELPPAFGAGRYHSLYAKREHVPESLQVTAQTSDGVVMAVEHRTLNIAAVQFHPESIMTASGQVGLHLVDNVVRVLCT